MCPGAGCWPWCILTSLTRQVRGLGGRLCPLFRPKGGFPQELCSPPVWLAPSLLVKEEEKQKLLQRGSELQSEHRQMEARDRRLASAVKVHGLEGAGS